MYRKFRPYSIWLYTIIALIFWMAFSPKHHPAYEMLGFPFHIADKTDLIPYLVVLLMLYQLYKWWDRKLYSATITWITVFAVFFSLAATFIYYHGYETGKYVTRTMPPYRGHPAEDYRVYILPHTPLIIVLNLASLSLYFFNLTWKGLQQDRVKEEELRKHLDDRIMFGRHIKKRGRNKPPRAKQ